MAADLLRSVVNDAAQNGVLTHPLGPQFGGDYPIIQYADDTLIIMPAEEVQLLKDIMAVFASSTGLRVNYWKSFIVPINVPDDRMVELAQALGIRLVVCPLPIWVCLWD